MTDINIELFKRTSPVRKIEIIKNLTRVELSSISKETILRIVKETGRRRKGNNWNSLVEGIWLYKGKPYILIYVQLDNTDSSLSVPFNDFFKKGEFRGTIKRDDRYGNPQTCYYVYDEKDKAEVMRSICLEYVNTKYKERLNHITNSLKQQ